MNKEKSFKIKLLTPQGSETWKFVIDKKLKDYGLTVWEEKIIYLSPDQSAEEMVDTIIHEVGHVTAYESGESDLITRYGPNVTAVLLKLDLIKIDDED